MLNAVEKPKYDELAQDSVDIDVIAVEAAHRSSKVVLPPINKLVQGKTITSRVVSSMSTKLEDIGRDIFQKELSNLLKKNIRFADSPTYLTRVSSLLQFCDRPDEAIKYSSRAAEISQATVYKYKLAEAFLCGGKDEPAYKIFNDLRKEGSVDSLLRLAEFNINNQNLSEAENLINEAILLDGLDWRVRMLAGTIALSKAQYEQALRHYRIALEDKPNSGVIRLNMAIAYYLLGRPDKAIKESRTAVGINPWNSNALHFYADIAMRVKKELELKEVEHYLKLYISIIPEDKVITKRLADLFFLEGKVDEGIALLEKVKNRFNDPVIWNNLGALWSVRQLKNAALNYKKAIDTAGGISEAHNNYGASVAVLNLANTLLDANQNKLASDILNEFILSDKNGEYVQDELLCKIPYTLIRALARQDESKQAIELAQHFLGNTKFHIEGRVDIATFMVNIHSAITGNTSEALIYARLAYDLACELREKAPLKLIMAENNLAYALIEENLLHEAQPIVDRLRLDIGITEYVFATKGLFALHNGQYEKGLKLYERAISLAHNNAKKNVLRQKMNLEIGRYWYGIGEYSRAGRSLTKVIENNNVRDVWKYEVPIKIAKNLMVKIKSH